jgi:methenyltetrahydromethanopterin cyclohydrolase
LKLVKKLIDGAGKYNVSVEQTNSGATLIDSSIKAQGGFLAGKVISEICLGGYATVKVVPIQYNDTVLPSAFVHTDYPVPSTLASQLADWKIKVDNFSALACGPARALALEPAELFERISYREEQDIAVLALETETRPTKEAIEYVAGKCNVAPSNLYLILYSPRNLTGATQISSRTVGTGMFKLLTLGFDPWLVQHAWGYAPILPLHHTCEEETVEATDVITYGGTACYQVSFEDDQKLADIAMRMPASASKMLKEAAKLAEKNPELRSILNPTGYDSNEDAVSPALVKMNNLKTGKNFSAGNLEIEVLKELFRIL